MRSLLSLVILAGIAFVLVAMYVAPSDADLRGWYLRNACEHLDKVSRKICAPMREADIARPI